MPIYHSSVCNRYLQGCSQPHSPVWARLPLSSFFLKFRSFSFFFHFHFLFFFIFPQTLLNSSFFPLGGRVAHPGRPWLRLYLKHTATAKIDQHCLSLRDFTYKDGPIVRLSRCTALATLLIPLFVQHVIELNVRITQSSGLNIRTYVLPLEFKGPTVQ